MIIFIIFHDAPAANYKKRGRIPVVYRITEER